MNKTTFCVAASILTITAGIGTAVAQTGNLKTSYGVVTIDYPTVIQKDLIQEYQYTLTDINGNECYSDDKKTSDQDPNYQYNTINYGSSSNYKCTNNIATIEINVVQGGSIQHTIVLEDTTANNPSTPGCNASITSTTDASDDSITVKSNISNCLVVSVS